MSAPTPRTDEQLDFERTTAPWTEHVLADFARALERDLADSVKDVEIMRQDGERWREIASKMQAERDTLRTELRNADDALADNIATFAEQRHEIEELKQELATKNAEILRSTLAFGTAVDDHKYQRERADDALLELAQVRAQRDLLAEALRDMLDISAFEEWATATTGKQIVFKFACDALDAVEGGQL